MSLRVIIVGAGVSGIAAATRLKKCGVDNVTILEASNRMGGRVNTCQFGDGVVELGAQWVHGQDGNVVFSLAKEHLDTKASFHQQVPYSSGWVRFVTENGNEWDSGKVGKVEIMMAKLEEEAKNETGSSVKEIYQKM